MPQRSAGLPAALSEDRLDRLKEILADVRRTLGVAWAGELFEALAVYDVYVQTAWYQLKPSVTAIYFERTAREVATRAAAAVQRAGFPFSDHQHALGNAGEREDGVRPREAVADEIAALGGVLDLLERLNPAAMLIATAVRDALLGREVGSCPPRTGPDAALAPPPRPAPEPATLRWSPEHGAEGSGPAGAALPSKEYRLLAVWPTYFAVARRELRPLLRSEPYQRAAAELDVYATAAVRALPYPFRASGELARSHGYSPAEVNDLLDTASTLQKRLCELTLQVAALRLGWQGGNLGGA